MNENVRETIAVGSTIEAAVAEGARALGADAGSVTYEVLEQPKKGFLGFGEAPAKVKVFYTVTDEDTAVRFVRQILADIQIDAMVSVTTDTRAKRDRLIQITGEQAGVLIGHHGETLEALQYLVNLAACRKENKDREEDEEETNQNRYTVDIENYRYRREQTLKRLAHRMADRALRTHRNVTLEPMNPYERRIIHAEVQTIAGVTTSSTGSEGNRRVVIYPGEEGTTKGGRNQRRRRRGPKPEAVQSAAVEANEVVDSEDYSYEDQE